MPTPLIVTDSNASLPRELVRGLPLVIVPMEIHAGGHTYHDGVDLTPQELYAMLEAGELATTSPPQPGAYLEAFREAREPAREIVCLTPSAGLSAAHKAAILGADAARTEGFDIDVRIIDTHTAGGAQGLVALAAARAAAGGSKADVIEAVNRGIAGVAMFGYLDSLRYLWRNGRVPRIAMWLGELVGVKPILSLVDGSIGLIERPRTRRRAMDRLVALAAAHLGGARGRIAVMHANAPERAEELAERLRAELGPAELFVTEFTPVIGAHVGPGLVGCALHAADG
ncbi:MAG: DegV family protein [Chloroflexi bacterium]|nr:DegV family protein [Chloroflexota bacterium]